MEVPSWTNSKKPERKNDDATHPSKRFAGESHAFDLDEVLRDLRAEAHPAEHGHRQITIFQRAPVTAT